MSEDLGLYHVSELQIIIIIIPSDENTSFKVSEKLSKYKDLKIEITRMWQMKREIIPVVVAALGGRVIKKGSEELVREIPGNVNLWEIQKTTLVGTAHILRKVLSVNTLLHSRFYCRHATLLPTGVEEGRSVA